MAVLLILSSGWAEAASTSKAQWWIWPAAAGGSDGNGGGFDSSIAGAGTNYANQSAPQIVFASGNSNLLSAANGSTTLTSAGTPFTSLMVGNAIQIVSGTNFVRDLYWIVSYTNSSSVVVDRTVCSNAAGCTAGTGQLGGALATLRDFAAPGGNGIPNLLTTTSLLVPGNIVNLRGSGNSDPAPGSIDYDFSQGYWMFPSGSSSGGVITILGFNGRPEIGYCGLVFYGSSFVTVNNVKTVQTTGAYLTYGLGNTGVSIINSILDQNGYDSTQWQAQTAATFINNEVRNSGSPAAGNNYAIVAPAIGNIVIGNYIHDVRGGGVSFGGNTGGTLIGNIIANVRANDSVHVANTGVNYSTVIAANTIDNGAGNGISLGALSDVQHTQIYNNIISNHSGSGKYGLSFPTGQAANDQQKPLVDFNDLYNNTGAYHNVTAGAHDLALNPSYAGSTNYAATNTGLFNLGSPGAFPGGLSTSYVTMGAVIPQIGSSSGGVTRVYSIQ